MGQWDWLVIYDDFNMVSACSRKDCNFQRKISIVQKYSEALILSLLRVCPFIQAKNLSAKYFQTAIIIKKAKAMLPPDRKISSPKETYCDQTSSISTFVIKIYNLLNDPQNASAICWAEDGKSFAIKNTALLTNHILPHYFRHNNYQSFIRQLNMYNFTKLKDHAVHRFENAYFIREREELLKFIKRKPEKKKRRSDDSISSQKENQLRMALVSVKSVSSEEGEAVDPEMKAEDSKSQEIEAKPPQPKKRVGFTEPQKVEHSEENISTIIEATSKWINNKEESYWNNFKSLKSIQLSMKLIDNQEEDERRRISSKHITERSNTFQSPIILLFNPNISEKTIRFSDN